MRDMREDLRRDSGRGRRNSKRAMKKSRAKQEETRERRRQALALQILQAERSHQPEENILAMKSRLAALWPDRG